MPRARRPLIRDRTPAAASPSLERLGDRRGLEWPRRRADTEKQLSERQRWPAVAQVVEKRRADRVGERQDERGVRLRPADADPARAPLDIVEPERGDLARAQPVRRDEEKHRVVAAPDGRRATDRLEKSRHRLPRKRTREPLAAIYARGVDRKRQPPRGIGPRLAG